MESRKSKRESFIGSNRKRVFDESVGTPNTNLFMDDYIKKSIDDYFEQMRRDNEAEYIPPTDEGKIFKQYSNVYLGIKRKFSEDKLFMF